MHQHIGEICTEMLVYEKGGVIKHVKGPASAKFKLPKLWKNKMCDKIKLCQIYLVLTVMTVVYLSLCQWHG